MYKAPATLSSTRLSSVAIALAALAGATLVQWSPLLPPAPLDFALGVMAVLLAWHSPRWRWLALLLLAVAWCAWRAALVLDQRLPRELEKRDFDVSGVVTGLPETGAGATVFNFIPEQTMLDGRAIPLHGELRVAWYGAPADRLQPCTRWTLRLRLRRPRGLLDPGAFDSERYALVNRRSAVGYVRDAQPPVAAGAADWCVDRWRARIAAAIATAVPDACDAHLLQALTVGDTRGLSDADWAVARVTGVTHLLAISGFHVGVAALAGVLLVRLVWWALPWLALRVPRQPVQALAALLAGSAYGALAGFGLPTTRTLLMIGVAALALGMRRAVGALDALALALLAILVVDPLAVLSAGFWLSFAGVAFLMLGFARPRRLLEHLKALGAAQWAMSVALLPLTVAFFGQAAPLGALSNLVAVPVVSLLAVPAALLGVLAWPVSMTLAAFCWQAAAWVMHMLWSGLAVLAALPASAWYLPLPTVFSVGLALLGAVWLLLPRGVPLRWFGLCLFLPLLAPRLPAPAAGAFQADVLDVGQGLSVLLRTRHHALLYDAGAKYPSGFDVGEAAVLPALHALGVRELAAMMISHGDNDHAGGAPAVALAYPHAVLFGSEPARSPLPLLRCRAGQHWHWDGVSFRVLHPTAAWQDADNDGSCVLLVTGAAGRMLLTGDISATVEPAVAAAAGTGLPLVLLVPHHGSKSSSSGAFLTALAPQLALVSAGWLSRYGHPAASVVARYRDLGIPLLNTADSGAIGIDFPADGAPRLRWRWRRTAARYWRE
ncbi:MAG TPA: DNA internalization-related competence protein ComEC/Rec2 [Rhodanobacteraceae bacterium]|nr:DNA internalization-related competence protein ComEC/Rec2 [Rhodanobacteraceae bacterium]